MTLDATRSITLERLQTAWPTIERVLRDLGVTRLEQIGSTGKKDPMGDIDVAVEYPGGRDCLFDRLRTTFGAASVRRAGSGVVSLAFPIDEDFVQVDLMVGDVDYLSWARCGTTSAPQHRDHSLLKGVVRNVLLSVVSERASLAAFPGQQTDLDRTRYSIDFDRGLLVVSQTRRRTMSGPPLKEWKTLVSEFITNSPDEIVRVLIGKDHRADNLRTCESLACALAVSRDRQELEVIVALFATKLRAHDGDVGDDVERVIATVRSIMLDR